MLAVAPEELTLGAGIRTVYIHVAMIWVGMAALTGAGALGLGALLTARAGLARAARTAGWLGLLFYAAGLALSVLAASVNWGGPFWQEPRMAAGINILVAGLLTQAAGYWFPSQRFRGFLHLVVAVLMFLVMALTPLVLHPRNPIGTSNAMGIQATFAVLFALCAVLAVWLVWYRREAVRG